MCGISGVFLRDADALPDESKLEAAASTLRHRGPDHQGHFVRPGVGLVHTRLSLVDLDARSDQPFFDRSGRYALIYNGEIYNFRALRAELEAEGVAFRTTSDTEVLLELLIAKGAKGKGAALSRLDGMFAFAFYDTQERVLLLGRDALGIKPLFYCERSDGFYFASEFQGFLPFFDLAPNAISISAYVQDLGVPTRGLTMFQGVRIVPPGATIELRHGAEPRIETFKGLVEFWDEAKAQELATMSPKALVDELDRLMTSSVKGQLFADAPVGAYCSGGVDSSLVVAIGSRLRKDLCIFHADVVGSCSERETAAAVARHLRLELRAVEVHPQEFIDSIPKVIQHYGYPFSGHPNSVPFLKVSQLVAQNRVKGVLSGEGSDELYLGYPKYFPPLSKFVRSLPTLAMKKWRHARGRGDKIHARRLAAGSMIRALHHRFGNEEEIEAIEQLVKGRREGAIDQRNLLSLKSLSHHLRTLLHRNDCLGMAASVESRFPFLDTELVRFAVNLPYAMKIRFESRVNDPRHPFFVDKWIVRKLASRYLPRSLSERPKKGFTVRAQKKMKIAPALFRNGFVARVFELTRSQTDLLTDRAAQDLLVRLMQLEVWSDVFFEKAPLERIGEKLRRHLRVK